MTLLLVKVAGKEIARGFLSSPIILVGRSPSCDILLRLKGVAPVHFLIEWIGDDASDLNNGQWALLDISKNQEKKTDEIVGSGVGQGHILSDKITKLGIFEFEIAVDRLESPELKGGGIALGIRQKETERRNISLSQSLLEVVTIDIETESFTDVKHFEMVSGKAYFSPVPEAPQMKVRWEGKGESSVISIETLHLKDSLIFNRGDLVKQDPEVIALEKSSMVRVRWQLKDYYFRLVPKLSVPIARHSLFSDKFYGFSFLCVVLVCLFQFYVGNGDFVPEKKIEPPPRIAKIEVRETPEVIPQPLPPEPLTVVAPKPVVEEKVASLPKFKTEKPIEKLKPKPALNSIAKKEEVSAVGLLGALKKGGATSATKIDTEKVINDGIASEVVAGANPNFVIPQSETGELDTNSKTGSGVVGEGLAAAASSVESGDTINSQSIAPIAGISESRKLKFKFAPKEEVNSEETVLGDLDKESVKRALAAYRKEIRTCYERALAIKPKLSGRIVYLWNISGEGVVTSAQLKSSGVKLPKLENCVLEVIKSIQFPEAPNKKPTKVIYPFEFQAKS